MMIILICERWHLTVLLICHSSFCNSFILLYLPQLPCILPPLPHLCLCLSLFAATSLTLSFLCPFSPPIGFSIQSLLPLPSFIPYSESLYFPPLHFPSHIPICVPTTCPMLSRICGKTMGIYIHPTIPLPSLPSFPFHFAIHYFFCSFTYSSQKLILRVSKLTGTGLGPQDTQWRTKQTLTPFTMGLALEQDSRCFKRTPLTNLYKYVRYDK